MTAKNRKILEVLLRKCSCESYYTKTARQSLQTANYYEYSLSTVISYCLNVCKMMKKDDKGGAKFYSLYDMIQC